MPGRQIAHGVAGGADIDGLNWSNNVAAGGMGSFKSNFSIQ